MRLKLYYNPGSCSLASHIALEEAGLDYEIEKIDLAQGAHETGYYRDRTPWARVPALEIGGTILTETVAILDYIAGLVRDRQLLPPAGTFESARALEWLSLLSSTIHIAFRPIFRPGRLAASPEAQADVGRLGLQTLNDVLGKLDRKRGDGRYTLGDDFSLVDAHLFVFLMWMRRPVLAGKLGHFPYLDQALEPLLARPSICEALRQEGLTVSHPKSG
jgi:glutathione S-transferase